MLVLVVVFQYSRDLQSFTTFDAKRTPNISLGVCMYTKSKNTSIL